MNRKLHEGSVACRVPSRVRLPMMRMALCAVLLTGAGGAASAQEVIQDFRGGKSLGQHFRPEGPNSHQYITPEPEGLRWRFSPGETPTRPVGIYWRHRVHGDFVATVHYEIVEAVPTARGGVGPEMYLMLDNPHRDGVAFTHLMQSMTAPTFRFLHLSNNDQGKRISKNRHAHPAPPGSERGRMQLAREGATLIVSSAPGDDEPLQEIHRADIGDFDIRMVRFAGVSGGDVSAKLDMRLLEFRIKGKSIGPFEEVAEAAAASEAPIPAPGSVRIWRFWGMGAAAAICLVGTLVVLTRRMQAKQSSRQLADGNLISMAIATGPPRNVIPSEAMQTKSDASLGMIGFACSSCGRNLKVKQDWAGKRVKCPECGHGETAPGSTAAK